MSGVSIGIVLLADEVVTGEGDANSITDIREVERPIKANKS